MEKSRDQMLVIELLARIHGDLEHLVSNPNLCLIGKDAKEDVIAAANRISLAVFALETEIHLAKQGKDKV